MPSGPTFDVFSGDPSAPRWIAAVRGFDNARTRMTVEAFKRRGKYFVWDARSRQIVASMDTSM